MKTRSLLIASIVLLILAGGYYWSERHKPSNDAAKASADAPPSILKLDDAVVTQIKLTKSGAEPIVLTKSPVGAWQISVPKPLGADQSAVASMVSTLASLKSERLVEEKPGDLKRFGLDQPAVEVELSEKAGKAHKLLIGDEAPTGGTFYAMLAADPRVFTIAGYSKSTIDKNLNDLRDKRLLTVNFDKISRVQLVRGKQEIEFGRNKDDWQIVRPKHLRADNSLVEDLIRKLSDAKMDLSGSPDAGRAASAFAAGAPVAAVKVTDESGTQELQVRKSKDTYYAKSSAAEGAYKITSDIGQAVEKDFDDFRNRSLFDFSFDTPSKIEWYSPSKTYALTRGGEDWSSNGTRMENTGIESVISDLRELKASKFADSGFPDPKIDVTVVSDEGKRVEKVAIAKSGDHYIARREGEATLYQLDASSVDDLQKALDALKPARPKGK